MKKGSREERRGWPGGSGEARPAGGGKDSKFSGKGSSFERTGSKLSVLLNGLLLGSLLLAGCTKKEEAAPTPVVTVEAAAAAEQPIAEHIVADAVLAPLAQAAITPKISAPVRKFYVQRGSRVKQGQLLATLENRDLAGAALDNQGSYMQAQAAYVTATKASVPEDYRKSELDLQQGKANLDLQQKIFDARKDLFAQGAIPGRDLDTARAALVQAQAAFDIAEAHFGSQKAVGREAALKGAQGQLESAMGKLQGAEAGLSYSEIRSPIAGVVTDRALFAGEMASGGQPLVTVMDTSSLLAKTHLPQREVQQLKVGAEAAVTVAGVEDANPGKVTLISPALDPGSTTVEVWIKVPNRDGRLKPGTTATVSIPGRAFPQALVVPSGAVVTDASGKTILMVVGADSVAHQRPVSIGISDGDKTQILSGLKAGEQVVSTGAYAMEEGTKVKVGADKDDKDAADKDGSDKSPDKGGADKGAAEDKSPDKNSDKGADKGAGKDEEDKKPAAGKSGGGE